MSNYVENGYSEGYVEGDNTSSTSVETVTCDTSTLEGQVESLASDLQIVKALCEGLSIALDSALSELNSIKQMTLSNASAIANLPSEEFIDGKIPSVADIGITVIPNGSTVAVNGMHEKECTIVSSRLYYADSHYFGLMYSVAYEDNGVTRISDFPSMSVVLYSEAEWG